MNSPIRKILVYVDGTEGSITAAQYAVVLSRSTGAQLTALYVVNTRALEDLLKARIFIKAEEEEYKRDLEADANRYLNHVQSLARKKGQAVEVRASAVTVYGFADPESYPLQKKRTSFERLREIAHLRPRTNTMGAVTRVRSALAFATHSAD